MAFPTCISAQGELRMHPKRRPLRLKNWYEREFVRKRELECRKLQWWQDVATYFDKAEKKSAQHSHLMSDALYNASLAAWQKQQVENEKNDSLEERRRKLHLLLQNEKGEYEEELRKKREEMKKNSRLEYCTMKSRADLLIQRREDLRKQEAERRLRQQWLENNHDIRDEVSRLRSNHTVSAWSGQVEANRQRRLRLIAEEEEFEKILAAERAKSDSEDEERERKRRNQVEKWRRDILAQIEEVKKRESETETLEKEARELMEREEKVRELRDEQERRERIDKERQLSAFWSTQYKRKLHDRARLIQESLEADEKMLEAVLSQTDTDKQLMEGRREKAKEDVIWMKKVIEEQRIVEARRQREFDMLFNEEAEKLYYRRVKEWEQETTARQRLMKDVMNGWKEQIQQRLDRNRENQRKVMKERENIMALISELNKERAAEEERLKQRREDRKVELENQMRERKERREEELKIEDVKNVEREDREKKEEERIDEELQRLRLDGDLTKYPPSRSAWM